MPNQQSGAEQEGRCFSPEELRGIRETLREAKAKLRDPKLTHDEAQRLIRDLTCKERELTQAIIAKSTWDKRFKKEGNQQ